jgi:hypothetical protein
MSFVTEYLLDVSQRSKAPTVPSSKARLRRPPTYTLLAADVDAEGVERSEDSTPLGHADVELSSDGRLLSVESGLPMEAWHASPRVPTPEQLKAAPLRDVRVQEVRLRSPVEIDYVQERDRGVWGIVVDGRRGELVRIATGLVLEIADDGRVVGLWLEGVTETEEP